MLYGCLAPVVVSWRVMLSTAPGVVVLGGEMGESVAGPREAVWWRVRVGLDGAEEEEVGSGGTAVVVEGGGCGIEVDGSA